MTKLDDVLRYAAFSRTPEGGNPAGVVLGAMDMSDATMQRIATDVGYSETAFITTPIRDGNPTTIRYFSPEGEVPFCGHATIATAAAIAEHVTPGTYQLGTLAGRVDIDAFITPDGATGSFASPAIGALPLAASHLDAILEVLGWHHSDLHPDFPPAIGTAGNHHPILVARSPERLAHLAYDFPALQRLSRENNWITLQLIAPVDPHQWRARNPFPFGGVIEDPATGSAAAAFAGYLQQASRYSGESSFTIHQGVEMGSPSQISVEILPTRARISAPATQIV